MTNAELSIDGSSGGILNIIAGNVEVNSGLLDLSTTTAAKIGSSSSSSGTLTLNAGNIQAFQIHLGETANGLGVLNLSNGLFNCSSLFTLGQSAGTTGIVSVAGGKLLVTNDLTRVGNLGDGKMVISGGEADFAFLSLGDNLGSSGVVALTSGKLAIVPRTTNDWLRIGNYGNAEFDVSGGTALVLSEVHIADNAGSVGTVVVSGGQFIATNDITAIGRYGSGLMVVSNSLVQLTNASVGRHDGAEGTLIVEKDGTVTQADDLSIGRFSGAIGHVLISGGSLALTNDNLWVGREGAGDLTVSNGSVSAQAMFVGMSPEGSSAPSGTVLLAGGTTVLSSNLIIGTSLLSTGQVSVLGGSLAVLSSNQSGYITIASGLLSLDGGTLAADQLWLTNSSGQLSFTGGQLHLRNATIGNGTPFVVGDGINPATLQLEGGTVSFADGLVISSNATITGCGTIVGNIVNRGTISTNCGPAAPLITKLIKQSTDATIYFTTANGLNYELEYKDILNQTNWLTLPQSAAGNGSILTIADTNAVTETRFYRVHVQ